MGGWVRGRTGRTKEAVRIGRRWEQKRKSEVTSGCMMGGVEVKNKDKTQTVCYDVRHSEVPLSNSRWAG